MKKVLFFFFIVAGMMLRAGDADFTERFEKRSVYGKWIDIDQGKIIEINSKSKFSFERLDDDLIILKDGSSKRYIKRIGALKTKIEGRIVLDDGLRLFLPAADTVVTLTNSRDSSIKASMNTNRQGDFSDASLPSGDYILSVSKGKRSLKVAVNLTEKSESLGTFVLNQAKSAAFKSKLSMEGLFIISDKRRYKSFVDILNYGNEAGRVCYSVSLEDSRLRELRFAKSCKVIPAQKSIRVPLYMSFDPIAINSTQKELKITMRDSAGRSIVEPHSFVVYRNFFDLKIKTANKAMKGYVVLPGQEVKMVNIKKGMLSLPKLSDEEYRLILANTDPSQKTAYEVDIGAEEKLVRGAQEEKKISARRGQKSTTFRLKQSISRYPDVGDIAIYAFTIPDSIVMQEHDAPIRIRFGMKNNLGEDIEYQASIGDEGLAAVTYKEGYLHIAPRPNANGVTTITLKNSRGYGTAKKKLFTLYIKAVNDKPVISSKPPLQALEGKRYSYYFKGIDAETKHLTAKALTLPKWLIFDVKKSLLRGKPQAADAGDHEVVLSLSDGEHEVKQSFKIHVIALEKAPESENAFFTLDEDTTLKGRLEAKAAKGKSLAFELLSKPKNGTLSFDRNGTFSYTPYANYFGNDSFEFKALSGDKSSRSLVTLSVNAINDAPTAQDIILEKVGAGPALFDWMALSHAADVDEDTLSVEVAGAPKLGTLLLDEENKLVYTPHPDIRGEDSAALIIKDGNGLQTKIGLTLLGVSKQLTPRVLQTGQKVLYHPFGDAAYKKSLRRSYKSDLKNRVIKDMSLKTTWSVSDRPERHSYEEAQTYCKNLDIEGLRGWRLPSIEELVLLTDKGRKEPAIDPLFSTVQSDYYWSSTAYKDRTGYRWSVYFDDGNDYFQHEKSKHYTLCMREGIDLTPKSPDSKEDQKRVKDENATAALKTKSLARYEDRETVWDKELELVWDDREPEEAATWVAAIRACEKLSLDGRSDWRLPNFNELYSLTDHSGKVPAVKEPFAHTKEQPYWSSTSGDNDHDRAWGISFKDGSDFTYDKTEQIYVRCVRDQ